MPTPFSEASSASNQLELALIASQNPRTLQAEPEAELEEISTAGALRQDAERARAERERVEGSQIAIIQREENARPTDNNPSASIANAGDRVISSEKLLEINRLMNSLQWQNRISALVTIGAAIAGAAVITPAMGLMALSVLPIITDEVLHSRICGIQTPTLRGNSVRAPEVNGGDLVLVSNDNAQQVAGEILRNGTIGGTMDGATTGMFCVLGFLVHPIGLSAAVMGCAAGLIKGYYAKSVKDDLNKSILTETTAQQIIIEEQPTRTMPNSR